MSATTNVDLLARDPDAIARKIAVQLRMLDRDAFGELTYTPTSPHSYYRDLLGVEGVTAPTAGAKGRLDRHATQMRSIAVEREKRAQRLLRAGSVEFRVEPNRTDGQGGYFSPPAWLNELFATANRPGRVLAGLMPWFPLPAGVSQINLPIIGTGTQVQTSADSSAVPDRDFTDSAGSSAAVPLAGQADVALQLLEQSPPGAYLDWAIFQDLAEDYDYQLESQLINGTGGTGNGAQLLGVTNVTGINAITYTGAVTGSAMYPAFGQAAALIGDNRLRPAECYLMRTARWAWLQSSEDTATRPFGLNTQFYLGNDDDTPDPIGGLLGWPTFLTDAIPTNLAGNPGSFTSTGTQDVVVCLRPTDGILMESDPRTMVAREPLSGQLGARIQMHAYAAAINGRRPAGISVIGGSGMAKPAGF